MKGTNGRPLEGIKIVELGQWIVLPAACAILSDWGADVIKIENPRGGDPLRGYLETRPDYPKMPFNGPFELDNRGKRSIAINLQDDLGREIVYRLIRGADIFATNLRNKVLHRWDMDYESLSQINPDLIYAEVSGYGEVGPDKDQPGFDRSAYFARCGMQDILREPDGVPPCMRPGFGDHATSMFVVATILAALWARKQKGIAQKVSLPLYHCGIWQIATDIQVSLISGRDIPKTSRNTPGNPLTNHYETKDGRWLILAMPPSDRYWPEFCRAIGREDLEQNSKYGSHQLRSQNSASLISILDEVFVTKTYAEWKDAFDEHGIVYGLIQTTGEVASDPQAWANDFFTTIEHPTFGKIPLVMAPGQFSKTPVGPRASAPEMGQHTEQVLEEIGYSWDDIVRYKEQGLII